MPFANPIAAREPVELRLVEEIEILTNVFETLLRSDDQGNLTPALCAKWEGREEGRSFLITLRPGTRFHDGHELTASDVKQCFEDACRHPTIAPPPALMPVVGAAAFRDGTAPELVGVLTHGANQLEIRLAEPLSIYPALLTDARAAIVRRSVTGGGPSLGTGPFRISEQDDSRVVLQRNDLWRGSPPALDAIEFLHGLGAAAIPAGPAFG